MQDITRSLAEFSDDLGRSSGIIVIMPNDDSRIVQIPKGPYRIVSDIFLPMVAIDENEIDGRKARPVKGHRITKDLNGFVAIAEGIRMAPNFGSFPQLAGDPLVSRYGNTHLFADVHREDFSVFHGVMT
jgi:hypothetical protein